MIAIACDHGGYDLKLEIIRYLKDENIEYTDLGCEGRDAVDYPVYARKVTDAIKSGTCEKGILICGTGIGISIAANKVPGSPVYGLFLRGGHQAAQQCQCPGPGRQSGGARPGGEDRGYVPPHGIFRGRTAPEEN